MNNCLNLNLNSVNYNTEDITNRYDIQWNRDVGSGANGKIYICIEKCTGEKFALKILDDNTQSRNELEMQCICQVSEFIVPIHEVFINYMRLRKAYPEMKKQYICVVMELMKGGDLFTLISDREKLNEKEAAFLIKQIAQGLATIHSLGIAHRDLKPENILLANYYLGSESIMANNVKIGDFGYAKEDDQLLSPVYTLYYVSPEVVMNDTIHCERTVQQPYDKRCDLWSLGVILYIMLLGYPPFTPAIAGTNKLTNAMKDNIIHCKMMIYDQKEYDTLSEEARNVIKSLLQPNPDDRITLEELLNHSWMRQNTF